MANRQQTYEAIEKMLSTLNDPFTRFLDPSKYSALKGGTKGGETSMVLCQFDLSSGMVTGVGLEVAYSAGMNAQPELMACFTLEMS